MDIWENRMDLQAEKERRIFKKYDGCLGLKQYESDAKNRRKQKCD